MLRLFQHLKPMRLLVTGLLLTCLLSCASRPSVYEPQSDREQIRLVVRQNLDQVRECYLRAIEERPGAEGRIVMTWEIRPDGSVANVGVKESGPKIAVIGPCLTELIGKWRFPNLNSDEALVEVSYPFYFSENGRFEFSN